MLWVPPAAPIGAQSVFHDAAAVTSAPGTSVLYGGSNAKGSWVQVIASTAGDVIELAVTVIGASSSTANSSMLLDIGIGAAGSETVLVADIPVGHTTSQGTGIAGFVRIPAYIPAGTRVAVRMQANRTSSTVNVPMLFNYAISAPGTTFTSTRFDTYGANTSASIGATVAPDATANVNGAWVELTASTARDHRGFLLLSQGWGQTATGTLTFNAHGYVLELGAGAAGSEVVLGSVHVRTSTGRTRQGPWPDWPIWRPIPAGTRLAARCRCSNASGLPIDAVAIGIS